MKNMLRKNYENYSKNIFIKWLYNTPGTFAGPSRDIPDSVYKMTRKDYPAYAYIIIRVRGQISSDRKNYGLRRNFSIFIWLLFWSGKFIFAVSFFSRKIM